MEGHPVDRSDMPNRLLDDEATSYREVHMQIAHRQQRHSGEISHCQLAHRRQRANPIRRGCNGG